LGILRSAVACKNTTAVAFYKV